MRGSFATLAEKADHSGGIVYTFQIYLVGVSGDSPIVTL
jgi:hypothetical protein